MVSVLKTNPSDGEGRSVRLSAWDWCVLSHTRPAAESREDQAKKGKDRERMYPGQVIPTIKKKKGGGRVFYSGDYNR